MIIPVVRSAGVVMGQSASCRQQIRSKSFAGEFLIGVPESAHISFWWYRLSASCF